jgi:plasmid stabilization system protein ParE
VSRPLEVEIAEFAQAQVRAAEQWLRLDRPKAPNAIREELERAASLTALQPAVGTRATNVTLPGVRRLRLDRVRYYVHYHVVADPERVEILAF